MEVAVPNNNRQVAIGNVVRNVAHYGPQVAQVAVVGAINRQLARLGDNAIGVLNRGIVHMGRSANDYLQTLTNRLIGRVGDNQIHRGVFHPKGAYPNQIVASNYEWPYVQSMKRIKRGFGRQSRGWRRTRYSFRYIR